MKTFLEKVVWFITFFIGSIIVALSTWAHPFLGILAFIFLIIVLNQPTGYSDPFDDDV